MKIHNKFNLLAKIQDLNNIKNKLKFCWATKKNSIHTELGHKRPKYFRLFFSQANGFRV